MNYPHNGLCMLIFYIVLRYAFTGTNSIFLNDTVLMPTIVDPPDPPNNLKPKPISYLMPHKYIGCNFDEPYGLGNQLFRMASLYGLGRYTGRLPYFEASNLQQMAQIQELSDLFPKMMEVMQIKSPLKSWVEKYEFADFDVMFYDDPRKLITLKSKYIKIKGNLLQCYKFFNKFRNEIRELYECEASILKNVTNLARTMFKNDKNFKLCSHVRRGDFVKDRLLETRAEFMEPAVEYARNFLKVKSIS